jgi:hypothetical protein
MKLLAAALSIAMPAAQAAAAENPHHNANRLQKPLSLDFSRVRTALANYVLHEPKSSPPLRAPMTRAITTLTDAGSGSLREALASAVDGDVIDLSGLHGTILLSSALQPTANVTINGPGRNLLVLNGGGHDRVLQSAHSLTLSKVTIANGTVKPAAPTPPYGGCLLVSGYLVLANATVTNCHVVATGAQFGFGGAIAVLGTPGTASLEYDTITNSSATSGVEAVGGAVVAQIATVVDSTISGNAVIQANGTTPYNVAAGGGIVALGSNGGLPVLSVYDSTISGNSVSASGGSYYNPVTMTTTAEYGTAAGGGVFGNVVYLGGSTVSGNTVTGNGPAIGGGGVLAGNSSVVLSSVSQNSVSSLLYSAAGGGLLSAGTTLDVTHSTFTANQVSSGCAACPSSGGGINVYGGGGLNVTASTVSGNSLTTTGATATPAGGGIGVKYATAPAVASATLTNSTISGNTLTSATGQSNAAGIWIGGNLTLNNSTVAFNSSDGSGGGITAAYSSTVPTPYTTTFYSSIVANNTAASDASTADVFSFGAQIIAGNNSLVMASGVNIALPGDTLNSDPMLQPLAFNGGPTKTHALDPASPAIDSGLSPVALIYDERWVGYPRVVGTAADIGAFELDTDRIFFAGFEFPILQ